MKQILSHTVFFLVFVLVPLSNLHAWEVPSLASPDGGTFFVREGVPAVGALPGGQAFDLRQRLEELTVELMANLRDDESFGGDLADGLLVCTFVDLNKLTRTSSFGRYVAAQLMGEFQKSAIPVIDARKSMSVMVQEQRGEFGLSRDPAEIASSHEAGAVLTGTYLVGIDEIILNAEIIENGRGRLLSSATMILPRNELYDQLLKDSASARRSPTAVTYMKRLEL